MVNQQTALDTVFHALADPTRRAVIGRLLKGAAPVTRLAEPFEMGLPAFLKHLTVLESSGLIRSEKAGRVRTCHINADRLAAAEGWLATYLRNEAHIRGSDALIANLTPFRGPSADPGARTPGRPTRRVGALLVPG